jgi:riboflavin biosynthesis pyrimidine reductase
MVEGGAAVLTSFAKDGLVDYQCVTISPKLLGAIGLPSMMDLYANHSITSVISVGQLRSIHLGPDCVIFSKWPKVK